MSKAHRKKLADLKEKHAHQIHHDSNTRYDKDILIAGKKACNIVQNTLIETIPDSQMTVKQTPTRLYQGLVLAPAAKPSVSETVEEEPNKTRTQVCALLQEEPIFADIRYQASVQLQHFMDNLSSIQERIISHEADVATDVECPCGRLNISGARTKATTKCMECSFSSLACSHCFVDTHVARFTHWAHVWDAAVGCFVRQDISCLGYVINLGHGGKPCPHPTPNSDVFFHIVDINGIHDTKLRFCNCSANIDRASQLLEHKLFPATMTRPTMAFTFHLLDFYNILHVEGKISAYDFIGSIRRMTDNSFTHIVTVRLIVYLLYAPN